MAKHAAILGVDTALGAYLARLLGARGYDVRSTGGAELLDRLGIAGDVTLTDTPDDAVDGAAEIYDLRYAAAVPAADGRLVIAVDPADTRRRAAVAAERAAGRFVAGALIWPHESRFGPGTSPIARIVAATATGAEPAAADLATSTDCGWSAEYVDALWRMAQRPAAAEIVIATGRLLSGLDAARVAATYFKRSPPGDVAIPAGMAGDPVRASAALDWRAVTYGSDLVTVLCEGAAAT